MKSTRARGTREKTQPLAAGFARPNRRACSQANKIWVVKIAQFMLLSSYLFFFFILSFFQKFKLKNRQFQARFVAETFYSFYSVNGFKF